MTTVTELERQQTPELTDQKQLLTPANLTSVSTAGSEPPVPVNHISVIIQQLPTLQQSCSLK